MITASYIRELQSKGVNFILNGDRVKIHDSKRALTSDQIEHLRHHKPEVIRLLRQQPYKAYWQERFEELAGHYEFEGLLPRHESEYRAKRDVLHDFIGMAHPLIMAEFEALIFPSIAH